MNKKILIYPSKIKDTTEKITTLLNIIKFEHKTRQFNSSQELKKYLQNKKNNT